MCILLCKEPSHIDGDVAYEARTANILGYGTIFQGTQVQYWQKRTDVVSRKVRDQPHF